VKYGHTNTITVEIWMVLTISANFTLIFHICLRYSPLLTTVGMFLVHCNVLLNWFYGTPFYRTYRTL